LKDKYGLSWQIAPKAVLDLWRDKDPRQGGPGDAGDDGHEEA